MDTEFFYRHLPPGQSAEGQDLRKLSARVVIR